MDALIVVGTVASMIAAVAGVWAVVQHHFAGKTQKRKKILDALQATLVEIAAMPKFTPDTGHRYRGLQESLKLDFMDLPDEDREPLMFIS